MLFRSPIGADAHLALAARLLPPATAGLVLALHLGAALAVAAYFASDIGSVGLGLFQFLRGSMMAFDQPARQSMIASIVPPEQVIGGVRPGEWY